MDLIAALLHLASHTGDLVATSGWTAAVLDFLRDVETWKLASIPVVAGVVGWGTNWAAIRLTFEPVEFRGIRPFLGWQGIIPSKAERMASIFVDSTMIKLGTLPELFQQMEPERIAEQIVKVVRPRMRRYTDEILFRENDAIWRATPGPIKERIYAQVEARLPSMVDGLMADATREIESLVDFKHMIVTRLSEDRALLNRLFQESGDKEFAFIVRSGLYFGFLFGLVQLAVWILHPAAWVLPVFGIVVGYATNWIALNVIFRPLHPTRVGPWVLQGIFLARQKEVAASWCRLVTTEIVSIRAIIQAMIHGPHRDASHALIRRHIEPIVDEAVRPFSLPVEIAVGNETLDAIRQRVGEKSVAVSTTPFDDWHFNRDRSERIEALLRERMENMEPEEFQGLLRPCFQEDELKLILVGAALGFLAGLGQLVFVFGGI
ncbi:MAG: hypothetical protein AAGE94_06770 [Acidobacteriota bacterium]